MISPEEKTALIATIGKHYSVAIIAHLQACNIRPKRAAAFTPNTIQQIVNGNYENIAVEWHIMQLVQQTKAAQKKQAKQRKQIVAN